MKKAMVVFALDLGSSDVVLFHFFVLIFVLKAGRFFFSSLRMTLYKNVETGVGQLCGPGGPGILGTLQPLPAGLWLLCQVPFMTRFFYALG